MSADLLIFRGSGFLGSNITPGSLFHSPLFGIIPEHKSLNDFYCYHA